MTDTTITTNQTLAGLGISSGDRYILEPSHNVTVDIQVNYANTTSPANNIVNEGTLVSHPDATHTHTIRYIGIDETRYVGSPSNNAPSTDPGIWVMGAGKLDIVATTRNRWNRVGTDATWQVGDDVRCTPWAQDDYTTYAAFTPGVSTLQTYVTCDGTTQTQEAFNLSSNVHIQGSATGYSHIMNMSSQPQTVKYAELRWMSPFAPGDTRIGRYALHNHRRQDATRGSVYTGIIANDCKGNVFVSHQSHGLYWDDCIAYDYGGAGFWYDPHSTADDAIYGVPANAPEDLTYDHCAALGNGTLGSIGFIHDEVVTNNHNEIFDCVCTGQNTKGEQGVYDWSNHLNGVPANVWNFHDNVVHNYKGKGFQAWQNDPAQHTLYRAIAFKVAPGKAQSVSLGAYRNDYDFFDSVFDDDVNVLVVSAGATTGFLQDGVKALPGQNWVRCHFGKAFIGGHGPLDFGGPTRAIDCVFHDTISVQSHIDDGGLSDSHTEYDFIRPNLDITTTPQLSFISQDAFGGNVLDVVRTQKIDGTAFQLRVGFHPYVYPFTWDAIAPFALYITTSTLNVGTNGVAYSQTLASALGVGRGWGTALAASPWSLVSGTLPTGLSLSTAGVLSGTPTQTGTFPLTFRVEDTNNFTADRAFSLVVNASAALVITTSSLPGGSVGTAYSQTLTRTGGTAPFTWSLLSGSLPSGLSLSSAGVISGTPTTANTYNFTVRVTDNVGATATRSLSIGIVNLNPSITTSSLPGGTVGVAYSAPPLVASGGTTPYSWSLNAGSGPLPAGLFLSSGGVISGTPGVGGSYPFTVKVTDALANSGTKPFTIAIAGAVAFVPPELPDAVVGLPYAYSFAATGGTLPYSFLVALEADLPDGLTISLSGILSGIPTIAGAYAFEVDVFDAADVRAIANVTLTVGTTNLTTTLRGVARALTLRGVE